MRHRANSFTRNSGHAARHSARLIATALIEHDERLLLAQLASGRFAGFWLLPSATVTAGTVAEAARQMVSERTGYRAVAQHLLGVQEEAKAGVLALRFIFATQIAPGSAPNDPEIARIAWLHREAVQALLAEREIVPTLGVMHLARAWAEKTSLPPLATLDRETLCPCGSGFTFRGCCGWDSP